MDSSAEALNEAHNVSHSGTLTVKQRHDVFVEEAFIYLLDYFGIQAKADGEFRFFNETTGRAIVTLSYVFRRRLRTFFKNAQINLDDIDEFYKILGQFEVIRDECYFFSILKKMSHVFEFIIFCLKEGYNYIETAREVFSLDHDTVFFENRGGLDRLNEIALFISEVGGVFSTVIQEEKPQDIVLRSFVNVVENLERPYGAASVLFMHRGLLSTMKNDAVRILENIHGVDPRIVQVFYHSLIPHSSKVFLMNPENTTVEYKMCLESEKPNIIDSFHALLKIILGDFKQTYVPASISIQLAGYFVIFRQLTDLISTPLESDQPEYEFWRPHPPQNCYSLKEYFLVPYDYIQMIQSEQRGLNFEAIDTFIEPSIQSIYKKSLRRVVNANIEQNNYFPLKNGRYVVYTPDCNFDDNTTCIVMPMNVSEIIQCQSRGNRRNKQRVKNQKYFRSPLSI